MIHWHRPWSVEVGMRECGLSLRSWRTASDTVRWEIRRYSWIGPRGGRHYRYQLWRGTRRMARNAWRWARVGDPRKTVRECRDLAEEVQRAA